MEAWEEEVMMSRRVIVETLLWISLPVRRRLDIGGAGVLLGDYA